VVIAKSDKKSGRPKGKKDSKPRKKKRKPPAKKTPAESQPIKQSAPTVKDYPKAGDNPEFVGLLDRMDLDEKKAPAGQPAPGESMLSEKDIAEWVALPFLTWAQYNHLSSLKLTESEAQSVAQPLTNILNRHGVGELIPPDMLDALKLIGRTTPIMQKRFDIIKTERQKNAGQGGKATVAGGRNQKPKPATVFDQGDKFREPVKV